MTGASTANTCTVEAALVPGLAGLVLRGKAERVDVVAGDAVLLGDALGGMNWSGMSQAQPGARRPPGPFMTFGPRPTRLMASTPQRDADVDGAGRR